MLQLRDSPEEILAFALGKHHAPFQQAPGSFQPSTTPDTKFSTTLILSVPPTTIHSFMIVPVDLLAIRHTQPLIMCSFRTEFQGSLRVSTYGQYYLLINEMAEAYQVSLLVRV